MFEVEVHQQLRAFLREQAGSAWPHHLTMARLVARALRLGRSSLIHLGTAGGHTAHRVSYLMAMLLWPKGGIVVAPEATLRDIMAVDLPPIQAWLEQRWSLAQIDRSAKSVHRGDRWPYPHFTGLLLTTPGPWLAAEPTQAHPPFPAQVPTLIEGSDDLEQWFINHHTLRITPQDWQTLALAYPQGLETLRNVRVRLTHTLFQRPTKTQDCCLLDPYERVVLQELLYYLADRPTESASGQNTPSNSHAPCAPTSAPVPETDHTLGAQAVPRDRPDGDRPPAANTASQSRPLPEPWASFQQALATQEGMTLASLQRDQGTFSLEWSPLNVAEHLRQRWSQQPVVLLRDTLAEPTQGAIDRGRIGLDNITVVQFNRDRHTEQVQLYLPDHLPLPNTARFYPALLVELRRLLTLSATVSGFTVILVNDRPLQSQVGATLAAEFGSRVQLEHLPQPDHLAPILVSGWEFWRQHQGQLPDPQLLVMATLPLPSLEDPRVAGRVAHYKQRRQDWFRCYLLPQALMEIQRAIAPVRRSQGVVALLDLRVLHRSYGQQILTSLSPMARLGYLDPSLFSPQSCLVEAP